MSCDLNTPSILLPFPKLDLHVHSCFWEVCQTFQRSLLILKCQWKRRKSPSYFSTYYSCSCCRQPSLSRKRFTTEMQFLLTVKRFFVRKLWCRKAPEECCVAFLYKVYRSCGNLTMHYLLWCCEACKQHVKSIKGIVHWSLKGFLIFYHKLKIIHIFFYSIWN